MLTCLSPARGHPWLVNIPTDTQATGKGAALREGESGSSQFGGDGWHWPEQVRLFTAWLTFLNFCIIALPVHGKN